MIFKFSYHVRLQIKPLNIGYFAINNEKTDINIIVDKEEDRYKLMLTKSSIKQFDVT